MHPIYGTFIDPYTISHLYLAITNQISFISWFPLGAYLLWRLVGCHNFNFIIHWCHHHFSVLLIHTTTTFPLPHHPYHSPSWTGDIVQGSGLDAYWHGVWWVQISWLVDVSFLLHPPSHNWHMLLISSLISIPQGI